MTRLSPSSRIHSVMWCSLVPNELDMISTMYPILCHFSFFPYSWLWLTAAASILAGIFRPLISLSV